MMNEEQHKTEETVAETVPATEINVNTERSARALLSTDKGPFLFTMLLTLIGLLFNYLIKQTIEIPSIDYSKKVLEEKRSGDSLYRKYDYTIFNLSREKSFKNLEVDIIYPDNSLKQGRIYNGNLITPEPASIQELHPACVRNMLISTTVEHLQPFNEYTIEFESMSLASVKELPHIYLSTDETIYFHPSDFFSWLAKNQIALNLVLIFFFLAVTVIYVLILIKK